MKEEFVLQQESFAKRLIDVLKQKFSRKIVFDYTRVIKTNDSYKPALVVREEGHQVGKTVYLDDVFKQYESGRDIEDIAEDLVRICEVRSDIEDVEGSDILAKMQDFEYLLDGHCVLKLINREKSQKYLEGKTFLPFLDLAIVFCMTLNEGDSGIGTIVIPEECSKHWNISLEEAFERILPVVERDNPIIRNTIFQFMLELAQKRYGSFEEDINFEEYEKSNEMYIQTNNRNFNGSITMLYRNNLSKFCEEREIDEVFILPSSQHEIILLPKHEGTDEKYLQSMIREVNATQVSSDEILSDNLYIYNRETDEITIWND